MSKKPCFRPLFAAITSILTISPHVLQAQVLEEIIVTATRREQSMQEVPISLEAFSAAEMSKQGYRDLNALAAFSPSVTVDQESIIGPTIAIRGFGSTGNLVTIESATPIFVDGIHFSRMSMMKTAFMDVQSVEVLKGPQPVYFGQNATAGAFNIQSKKPGETWEGDLDIEYGSNNTSEVNAGIGGPLSDTWQMRVAGKYETTDGYLRDILSGDRLGAFEDLGGRLTLQWAPSEQLEFTGKIDLARLRKDAEANSICYTSGDLIFSRSGAATDATTGVNGTIGDERSIFAEPPLGEGWATPLARPIDHDCNNTKNGVSAGGPYYPLPDYVRENNSVYGSLDVRQAAEGFVLGDDSDNEGIQGYENLDNMTSSIAFEYETGNGITINGNVGYVEYLRNYVRDNRYAYSFNNFQGREEDYSQWSSELRLTSPEGGRIEWYLGAFYQQGDLDVFSSSLRSNLITPQRYNYVWEDQEWLSGFGVVKFNFLEDNKASVELGGLYASLKKETYARGYAATWVYNSMPCDPDSVSQTAIPTAALIASCTGTHASAIQLNANQVRFYTDDVVDYSNLWTVRYNQTSSAADGREIPPNWLPSQAHAIGLTNPDFPVREGPYQEKITPKEFDPQVVLSYRPSDEMSIYGRWAQAFKAGGFDTGQTTIPSTLAAFTFGPELAETFELGVKGTYLEGRGRYDVGLFELTIEGLQLSIATPNPDDPFANLNAGGQRMRGLEFSNTFAVSDQLTVSLGGILLNGEMTDFTNVPCTQEEVVNPNSGCDKSNPASPIIDRTGETAPRSPDWKFVMDVDYWMPVFENYKTTITAKGFYSDGYITDYDGFTLTNSYKKHGDLNLLLSFGDLEDVWSVSLYGRNLFEARAQYQPEYDIYPTGLRIAGVSPNSFATYGVKLSYNYQ